jgi:REP element-mobilizing transposase RayT
LPDRKHLRRLDTVWIEPAIYFLTICTAGRQPMLARPDAFAILREEFSAAPERYGWTIGRFVAMPDHLHFFRSGGNTASLSRFVGVFKQWTAKRILAAAGAPAPLWQREFFDHLLRSHESYEAKWRYMRENPVRAGLVENADDWPYCGEIENLML